MVKVVLNYPAPIAVGHRVELTWFAAPQKTLRPKAFIWSMPHSRPVVKDLDTGITYMNHVHASAEANGGNSYRPNNYSLGYRSDLPVAEVWQGTVQAASLVFVEALSTQHTVLEIERG